MAKDNAIKIFEQKQVRTSWDEANEKWYFSIVDVIEILTESTSPRKYWSVLKTRLKKEGSELATNCSQLKMQSADGKFYLTDVAEATTTEISKQKRPKNFNENKIIAKQGGTIAGNTRKEIEEKTGKKVVSSLNVKKTLKITNTAKKIEENKNKDKK